MKTTQKELIETFKNEGERFNVISFNREDRRNSSYGALNLLEAFKEILYRQKEGHTTMVISNEGRMACMRYESINRVRCPKTVLSIFQVTI